MSELTSASSKLVVANTSFALDASKLEALKNRSSERPNENVKAVAQQFESLFIGMMLKSMRDAIPKNDEGSSDTTKTYLSMLDQQLAQALTSQGGLGIAAMIEKQLSIQKSAVAPQAPKPESLDRAADSNTVTPPPAKADRLIASLTGLASQKLNNMRSGSQRGPNSEINDAQIHQYSSTPNQSTKTMINQFKEIMSNAADAASRTSGIPSVFILAQAALESGWGKSEVIDVRGTKSHNLFGIKATGNWKGKIAESLTTEFINGEHTKVIAKFRAYESYAESLADFAQLITHNARYRPLAQHLQDPVSYGQAMQDAGYATDPDYAKKLSKVIYMLLNTKD